LKNIATINPALYGGLVKVLSFLSQGKESTAVLSIKNGILDDMTNTGFVHADLTSLFGENSIDFIDPAKTSKLLKLLSGGDQFAFIDDEENNRYIVTNILSTVQIPKAMDSSNVIPPVLDTVLSSTKIDTDSVFNIDEAQKTLEADHVVLYLDNDHKVCKIGVQDTYKKNIVTGKNENELTKYQVFCFMPLKGSDYTYQIVKHSSSEDIWLKTTVDLDILEITYYEKLAQAAEFDAFSLI